MEASGKLGDRPLPDLLHHLFAETVTGVVKVNSRMGGHLLYLREGYPVAVVLPGSAEMLGKVLLEMGILNEATYRESLTTPPPKGKRYGDLLIEKGMITVDQLRLALKAQTRRKLHRMFFLNDGQWTFEAGEHGQGLHGSESLRVHPYRAIYHGVRSAWAADRLQGALFLLDGKAIKLKVTPEEAARYGLGPDDGRVAELLRKGYWTVADLVEGSGLPVQAVHALVYAFYITSALDIQAADAVPRLKRKAGEPPLVAPTVEPAPVRPESSGTWRLPSGTFTMPQPSTPKSIVKPAIMHTPPGGSPVPDIDTVRKQIELKAKVVEVENLFEVLGLPPTAGREQIKSAYFDAAKRFHPDRLASMGLEVLRPEVEKIFRRVSEAYGTLFDDAQRVVYIQQLSKPKSPDDAEAHAKAMRMLEAEMAFRRGEIALRKNDYLGAIVDFESALKANPQEGEHLAYLTWAKVCAGQLTHAAARPTLQQAVRLSPKCARAHYYYGLCLKEENDVDRAYGAFRTASELDPRLLDAEREMRLINMRKEKAKEKSKSGFFKKLLK
jgi:curved DNA-binding protein CbpA